MIDTDRPTAKRESGDVRAAIAMAQAGQHFPFGILLLDGARRVVTANRQAATLLGEERLDRPDPELRCCELFGCGTPDGPPQGRCLTELALGADEQLPEIRLDLGPDEAAAVWVSAARTPEGGVSLSVRPGVRGDRRRRTEPHWVAGPTLRIKTFGSMRVSSGESSLDGGWTERRTGKLLKYLITERHHSVRGEQIVAALWPGAGPDAMGTLRQCVHALRDKIEPERSRHDPSSFILARGGGYELDLRRISIDADEFERRAAAGLADHEQGNQRAALQGLQGALELYGGDFLGDDPYEEWVFAERDRLRDLAGQALRIISEIHLASGEIDAAAEYLGRLAQVDPYDVDIQRQLIGLYLGAGRRSQAVRRYERLRQQMQTAFGETLSFALSDIADETAASARRRRPAR